MAKEKSYRSPEFLSGQRALRMSDLSPQEQKTAVSLVSDVSKKTRSGLKDIAAIPAKRSASGTTPTEHEYQKAAKAKDSLSDAVNKPFHMHEAVEERVRHITNAATTYRLPDEHIGGAEFYYNHRKQVDDIVAGSDTSISTALDAGSKLSVRTAPVAEKESLTALISAHKSGVVHFDAPLINALSNLRNKNGERVVSVPEKHWGKSVPFSEVHPKVAAELTNPAVRDIAKQHSTGVDLDGLAKTAIRGNISHAQSVMQGEASSPYTNPKQISYAAAHMVSEPGTSEHEEYRDRARKVGEALRNGAYQESFDFHNLRSSNEGALSNKASTPADLWERRVSYAQPGKAFTTSSDANYVTKKSRTTPSGKVQTVGLKDAKVTPIGIEHAVHQEAVHQTATHLQQKLGLDFTVPATLVQETTWAGARRAEGQDPQYSAALTPKTDTADKRLRSKEPSDGMLF
jgi:hypothetical protein